MGEQYGEYAYLLVGFRASRLAFDRSLCHGEEKRERERCMARDAEGNARAGMCRAESGGNSRMARNITVEVRERQMPSTPLAPGWQLPQTGRSRTTRRQSRCSFFFGIQRPRLHAVGAQKMFSKFCDCDTVSEEGQNSLDR